MNRDAFVETSQVVALREAVTMAMGAGAGFPGMVMGTGKAGTGKTRAARALFAEHGGVYLRAMQGMSQAAFLQTLCFEVTGTEPHGSMRCKRAIIQTLGDEPAPIFVDEPERLHTDRLEDLRDIHDMTGAPIVLIGELALETKVNARSRLNDRIPEAFRVSFGEISSADVLLYAEQAASLALTPAAAAYVKKHTQGNFRRVYNALLLLEAAAKVFLPSGRKSSIGNGGRMSIAGMTTTRPATIWPAALPCWRAVRYVAWPSQKTLARTGRTSGRKAAPLNGLRSF